MALSNKIRQLRFTNGEMTQKRLAELVGVSRQTMNAIENGRHAPTIDVAIRIADVFHISVDQLFDLDYDGKPARREHAARVAIDRPRTAVGEPVEVERDHGPANEEVDMKTKLRNLRNVIG